MMHESLLHAIGNTPLVRVNFGTPPAIYAKLEYLNPGGSVKDRSALFMIEDAERRGLLKPGGTIIDATSGNHGIAIAMIGALKGYKIIMCPITEYMTDPESYHSVALRIHKETPNSFMPNQYYNPDNALGHYTLLGPEIWQQTKGKITHFFAAAGTGGTVSGAGKYLKEKNSNIKVIALDSIHSFRATKGNPKPYKVESMGVDFDNEVLNPAVIDEFFNVTDDQALGMLKPLAREHGLLVGPSSAAVAYGVKEYSKNLSKDDLVVMIFGDSGRAYLSKYFI
jgi:cystathionine beta-synthase